MIWAVLGLAGCQLTLNNTGIYPPSGNTVQVCYYNTSYIDFSDTPLLLIYKKIVSSQYSGLALLKAVRAMAESGNYSLAALATTDGAILGALVLTAHVLFVAGVMLVLTPALLACCLCSKSCPPRACQN
jgi:hypothetical protein